MPAWAIWLINGGGEGEFRHPIPEHLRLLKGRT
jgi:hypothetical protein